MAGMDLRAMPILRLLIKRQPYRTPTISRITARGGGALAGHSNVRKEMRRIPPERP